MLFSFAASKNHHHHGSPSLYVQTMFAVLMLQSHASHAADNIPRPNQPHPHPHPHGGQESCPPHIASSAEEVGHYCHQSGRSHFQVHKSTYQCWGTKQHTTLCQGIISQDKKLPTCSQATIDNCGDEALYDNFSDQSHGPCLYRDEDITWHSAKCGNGVFACWDPTLNEWCEGTVLNDDVPEPTPTCPPAKVFSVHEATHYCSKSGLAITQTKSDDDKSSSSSLSYHCYWKNGTSACEGTIDPKHHKVASCSAPIDSCDNMMNVCHPDHSRVFACNEEDSHQFECWDKKDDQWCLGHVHSGAAESTKKPYPARAAGDAQRQSLGIARIAMFLTMFAGAGMVVERKLREKFSPSSGGPNEHFDTYGYQAVNEDMAQDFELALMP